MKRRIVEFSLGALVGMMIVMTFAYMSVEIHDVGPVIVDRTMEPEPRLMLELPELAKLEKSPVTSFVLPQPAAAAEFQPRTD